jgi:succinate dehydrogenase / fumarate reductase flavoprotein subunit
MPGLYAAGECACVSVHGANRLGTNSLVDIVVFGRRAGIAMLEDWGNKDAGQVPDAADAYANDQIEQLMANDAGEPPARLRSEMQKLMSEHVGVFRTQEGLEQALQGIKELQARFRHVRVMDRGKRFNTDLLEAWELGCLLDLAEATTAAALARTESRGAHWREDYPRRDDDNWLKHSLALQTEEGIELRYKPVTITNYAPKERVY